MAGSGNGSWERLKEESALLCASTPVAWRTSFARDPADRSKSKEISRLAARHPEAYILHLSSIALSTTARRYISSFTIANRQYDPRGCPVLFTPLAP